MTPIRLDWEVGEFKHSAGGFRRVVHWEVATTFGLGSTWVEEGEKVATVLLARNEGTEIRTIEKTAPAEGFLIPLEREDAFIF
jgi:hypothetical protein